MERHFDQQLGALRKNLIQMASMIETAIANAVKSLIERNSELAYVVVQNDEQVDALELEIDKQCIDLLALRQPLANDLRFITSAIKIINNLERMGDLAVNIAELLTYMMEDPVNITRAVHLILISRHLERIADHSTNIAEEVVYIVKAKVVKNRAYNLDET